MATDRYMSPMLAPSQVAQLLNVHINTVRRWSNQGVIKAYRVGPRGDRRFRKEDVTDLLQELKTSGGNGASVAH